MKLAGMAAGAALLLHAALASAQVYKWVDEKGVTHYGDAPPARQQAEIKAFAGGAAEAALPYELATAVRNAPVTLYTTVQCKGCDEGRKLLAARGIPFAEKTVTTAEDHAKLRQVDSQGQLPLLLVGRSKLVGFQAEAWNAALTNAAYPTRSMLPARYRNPDAAAAAPSPPPPETPRREAREATRGMDATAARGEAARAREKTGAPPGFQF